MPITQKKSRTRALFFVGGAIGVLFFLAIFGFSVLNPLNDAFCRGGFVEKDIQQHYAGWLFLRQSGLSLPFCMAQGINWPTGISVAYTDSIPLFAAFFRLLSPVLPGTFQYFGIFSLLCWFLQGGFAAILIGLFFEDTFRPLAGSVLFVISPVLVERTLHHTALAAQFLILAALYYYIRSRRENRIDFWPLWVLNALCITIHPYFVPMMFAVTFAMLAEYALQNKTVLLPAFYLGSSLLAAVLAGWCFGLFASSASGGGELLYGYFGMNLNALWNPASIGTVWSLFLPVQNQVGGNYDAFNYLGLGILLLCVFCAAFWLRRPQKVLTMLRRHWVLLLICGCLTLFAVSNHITANGATLLQFDLPLPILRLCSVLRSGGRMFWPVYYLIFAAAIAVLSKIHCSKRTVTALLLGVVALQLLDLSPALAARHEQAAHYQEEFPTQLTSSFWEQAAGRYQHIFSLDSIQEDALHLALYAADNGMTTNDPFAARYDAETLSAARSKAVSELAQGQADADTLYLMQDEGLFLQLADRMQDTAWCGRLEGTWYVIAPGMQYTGADAVSYSDSYPLHIADYTDENWDHGVLTWDHQTVIFPDSAFTRKKLENASALLAEGTVYPIVKIDDSDAGWLMVTLQTDNAAPLQGAVLAAQS